MRTLLLVSAFLLSGCISHTEQRVILVDSELVNCVGVAPMQCMQVKSEMTAPWQLYYGKIHGFAYEPGYQYSLLVDIRKIDNPPADTSSEQWNLIKIIDKSPAIKLGSPEWQIKIDKIVRSADQQGHGPDIGSDEWCGVIEFKLFNRLSGLKPCSAEWNNKVNKKIQN